jgi:hypothetical protein
MRWSKLKHLTEQRFAPEARCRVGLWTTRYRYHFSTLHEEGRSWITVDGVEVVNMTRHLVYAHGYTPGVPEHDAARLPLGLFDTYDLPTACEAMLTLRIDEALASANPLLRSLALLDARCGRRRLATIDPAKEVTPVPQLLAVRQDSSARLSHVWCVPRGQKPSS